jgi:CheY-like chemotaxis protein
MLKAVLLVDDDPELRRTVKEGMERSGQAFKVVTAAGGLEALETLKRLDVSLVVTDLKMPHMDGLELLAEIIRNYPHIPVILISGYGTPEVAALARREGAVDLIAKPFRLEVLAERIRSMLDRQAEGGRLHDVSTTMFLQLIGIEQKTCTIRLNRHGHAKTGVLFFVHGELYEARCGDLRHEAAVYEIFSWDPVSLSIQNDCPVMERRIKKNLNNLILEAARRKDERDAGDPAESAASAGPADAASALDRMREKIESAAGPRFSVKELRTEEPWSGRIRRLAGAGLELKLGKLLAGHIDDGEPFDYLIVADPVPAAFAVSPKGSRDRLLQLLL